MVILACLSVQQFFDVSTIVVAIVGERIPEGDIVDEEIVDERIGYEEIYFMDGSLSKQETTQFSSLIFVPKVTKI